MWSTGGGGGTSRPQQGRSHLSLPCLGTGGPGSCSRWHPREKVPGRPMGGHAHLVELHVIVLDALHPGVLAAGASALSLLVP